MDGEEEGEGGLGGNGILVWRVGRLEVDGGVLALVAFSEINLCYTMFGVGLRWSKWWKLITCCLIRRVMLSMLVVAFVLDIGE